MKTYTIIGGVNGTGKSSLTGILQNEVSNLGIIINVDKLALKCNSKISAGKVAIKHIDKCINEGVSFTQETTLSGHRTVSTARKALDKGYFIRLYYVGLDSLEESIKRINNRVLKGGHDINSSDVAKRYKTRINDIASILPYCNEAIFYDNNNGFKAVAKYFNGELTIIASIYPNWVDELKQRLEKM